MRRGILLVLAILLSGCAAQPGHAERFDPPACEPECVAWAFAEHMMGQDAKRLLAHNSTTFSPLPQFCRDDPSGCAIHEDVWSVTYDLRAPTQPWARALAEVQVTPNGTILRHGGLPPCRIQPQECDFAVTRERALDIARGEGLGGRLDASFFENAEHGYVWGVTNATTPTSGSSLLVDANSGAPLGKSDYVQSNHAAATSPEP